MKFIRSRQFVITLGALSAAIMLGLLLWWFVLRKASPPTHADIPYMADDEPRHLLDVYLPVQTQGPFPVVMILHGNRGDKTNFRRWGAHLAGQGYAVVLPSFRIQPVRHEDAFCALAWTHANANSYGFDTEHIFIIGVSSGGGIAAEMGTIDETPPFMGECPHPSPDHWTQGVVLISAGSEKWPEHGWRLEREPVIWIDGDDPPFLLIHGLEDEVLPAQDSEDLAALLEAAGIDTELLIIPGADHFVAFPGRSGNEQVIEAVDSFLTRLMKNQN